MKPYRQAARQWLKDCREDRLVLRTISELQGLIDESGRLISAYSVGWEVAETKARVAFARMRERGRTGGEILEEVLTVRATYAALGPHGNQDFLTVQVGKRLNRLAGGTHKTASGFAIKPRWPKGDGIYVRLLGQQALDVSAHCIDRWTVEEVLEIARTL